MELSQCSFVYTVPWTSSYFLTSLEDTYGHEHLVWSSLPSQHVKLGDIWSFHLSMISYIECVLCTRKCLQMETYFYPMNFWVTHSLLISSGSKTQTILAKSWKQQQPTYKYTINDDDNDNGKTIAKMQFLQSLHITYLCFSNPQISRKLVTLFLFKNLLFYHCKLMQTEHNTTQPATKSN